MASGLRRFHSITEFHLINDCDDGGVDDVIDALIGHSGLMKLTLSVTELRRKDGAALASLLQNPTGSISDTTKVAYSSHPGQSILFSLVTHMTLALDKNTINDDAASIFATGPATNTTLAELKISSPFSPH